MLLLKANQWIEDFTAYLTVTPAEPSSISFMASPRRKSPSDPQANQDIQLPLTGTSPPPPPLPLPLPSMPRPWTWWFMVGLDILLLLGGQSIGTLLGKFYYNQGGSSLWIQTLTLSAAFPILYLPLLLLPPPATPTTPPPATKIAFIYTALGLIGTADSLMYSYGLLYLPVSTYSLVCATQLGFNAVFSYFINSEKFTPLTLNSVVLLTFSAALLGLQPDPENSTKVSKGHYVLAFIITLGASATYSLLLSLIELTFDKVIKSQTFAVVLDM